MQAVTDLGPRLGIAAACLAVGLPKSTYYRRLKPPSPQAKRTSHRALGADERRAVLEKFALGSPKSRYPKRFRIRVAWAHLVSLAP